MKESYSEELVNHTDPESCESIREDTLEALTGETAGRAIEPRKRIILREADLLMVKGKQHHARRYDEAWMAPARSKTPGMWRHFSHGNREISGSALRDGVVRVRAWNPEGASMR